jgi:hypothetical protein
VHDGGEAVGYHDGDVGVFGADFSDGFAYFFFGDAIEG